ncbi:MAG: TolB family protein [Phycisphaeraceae bacterium]|nr:TolB family protein [Phycisphaeraceae bacterium]
MSTNASHRHASPTASRGVGSLVLSAIAAIGTAVFAMQLGGCATEKATGDGDLVATNTPESAADSESGVAWASPTYRDGWYEDTSDAGWDAPATPAVKTVAFTSNAAATSGWVEADAPNTRGDQVAFTATNRPVADATAVRMSMFADFGGTAPEGEWTGGEGNLFQVSFAAEGADFDPDVSSDGDWIIFASTQHREDADIYRKTIDGRVVTQLTSDPAQDVMPEIAPDGRKVVFTSDRNGNWDVFVMSVDGGPATQITFDDAHELHPTWSPDGSRLCYCRFNDRTARWELWTVSLERPGVRTFVCEGMFPRWSPDASTDRILFQRARKRGSQLYGVWTIDLTEAGGINPTEVVAAGDAAIMHPTWSPDGKRIAFTSVDRPEVSEDGMPVESDIWVIDADGMGRTALTSGGFRNMRPTWAADGRVYFTSNRGGLDVIWAVSGNAPGVFDAPGSIDPQAVAGAGGLDDDH